MAIEGYDVTQSPRLHGQSNGVRQAPTRKRRSALSKGGKSMASKAIRHPDEYAEFDCEGCGAHVYHYSLSEPPKHMFCATCLWLNEYATADEFWILYKRMTVRSDADSR